MSFEARFVVIVLAAFAWSSLAAGLVVPYLLRRVRPADPGVRSDWLVRLRLTPLMVGGCTAAFAATAFMLFEPRAIDEDYGLVLRSLAVLTVACFGVAGVRGGMAWRATRRLARSLASEGERIDLPGVSAPARAVESAFPIVAVIGVFRPTLVIARSVLRACSPRELAAILAHEQAHIDRRDNLSRLLLSVAPDVLAWLPASRRLAEAWHDAAEHAADDAAMRLGDEGRLDLADALLRVARLAPVGATALPLPTSALYRGEDLTDRVARLMTPLAPVAATRHWSRLAVAGALVACAATLEAVHELVEVAAAFLP